LVQIPAGDILKARDRFGVDVAFPVVNGLAQVTVTESVLYLDLRKS
jgi:hypothetical protein